MYSGRFSLIDSIGPGFLMRPNDVRQTKLQLGRLKYYEFEDGEDAQRPTPRLFDSIRSFQANYGLKVDGTIHPQGETEHTIEDVSYKPSYWCNAYGCNKPHGGVYSPHFCHQCIEKKTPNPHRAPDKKIKDAIDQLEEELIRGGGGGGKAGPLEPLD